MMGDLDLPAGNDTFNFNAAGSLTGCAGGELSCNSATIGAGFLTEKKMRSLVDPLDPALLQRTRALPLNVRQEARRLLRAKLDAGEFKTRQDLEAWYSASAAGTLRNLTSTREQAGSDELMKAVEPEGA